MQQHQNGRIAAQHNWMGLTESARHAASRSKLCEDIPACLATECPALACELSMN
jgi:hypothetical protein